MSRKPQKRSQPKEERGSRSVRVQVAELKSRLSEYLRAAEGGETVVVTAYGRPVAELGPHRAGMQPLRFRPATRPWGSVGLRRTGVGRTNSLALLMDERRKR